MHHNRAWCERAIVKATAMGPSPASINRDARMRSVKEDTLRARARKLGYAIYKSRSRSIHEAYLGRYALVKEDNNCVVLGERFDASLEKIAEYLD
jgi:hypothetical protein